MSMMAEASSERSLDRPINARVRIVACIVRFDEDSAVFPLNWVIDWILTSSGTTAKVLLFDCTDETPILANRYRGDRRVALPPPMGCGSLPTSTVDWDGIMSSLVAQDPGPMVIGIALSMHTCGSFLRWLADPDVAARWDMAGVRATFLTPFLVPLDFSVRGFQVYRLLRWGVDYLQIHPAGPVSVGTDVDSVLDELATVYPSGRVDLPAIPAEFERYLEACGDEYPTIYDAAMGQRDLFLRDRMRSVWEKMCRQFEQVRSLLLPSDS